MPAIPPHNSCDSKVFALFFLLSKDQFWSKKVQIDEVIADLLADKAPIKARNLIPSSMSPGHSEWTGQRFIGCKQRPGQRRPGERLSAL
jgi:hypothetical protein